MNLGSNSDRTFLAKIPSPSQETSGREKRWEVEENSSAKKLVKLFDFIIKFSLFAIFFGTPLFFTGLTYQGTIFEKQIYFYFWVLLALIAWASKCGYIGEMKIKKTPLDIPLLAFWASYLISSILSVDRWHSFFGFFGDPSRGFLNVTALIVVYYLVMTNFSAKLFKLLMRSILLSGSLLIAWSALIILNVPLISQKTIAFLPMNFSGSPETLTVFASFLIPLYIVRVFKIQEERLNPIKKKIISFIWIFFTALSLFLLFALYDYVEWLGVLVGMVALLVFVLSKIVRPKGFGALIPMLTFIFILVFLMIGNIHIPKVQLPLSANIPYKASLEIAKDSLRENFVFGNGSANFGYSFSKYLPEGFDNKGLRLFTGRGIIFESISTLGAVGAALLLILILTFLGVSLFLLSREKEKNKLNSVGLFAASMVILANFITEKTDGLVLIFGVLIGTLLLASLYFESNAKEDFLTFSLKASPKFALTLAFVYLLIFASVAFAFVFVGKMYVADLYMGKSARAAENRTEEAVSKNLKAVTINPREGRYFTYLGQKYMTLVNEELSKKNDERNVEKIQSNLSSAIRFSKQGVDMMKNDVTAVESLAQIYENSGLYIPDAYKFSLESYSRAREMEPFNPDFVIKIGQIKTKKVGLTKDDNEKRHLIEEARDDFQKAVDMRKNYAPSLYNLALAEEALGQLDEAVVNMTSATMLERGNINYVFNLARIFQGRGKNEDNKMAENLYRSILEQNDKEINTHFNLGLLYEKLDRKNEAIQEYQKVVELLPEGSDKVEAQLKKMITNIKNGIPNTAESLGLTNNTQPDSSPSAGQ